MFVDALGWRIVQEQGFLPELLPHQSPCNTVFGYSSTCDPTIITGTMPDEHNHFSCFIDADGKSPFKALGALSWLPHKLAGYHRVRNKLSAWYASKLGYTGYFQLYSVPFKFLPHLDYTEKQDIYGAGGSGIMGGQEIIFDHWERSGKKWMHSDWRKGDAYNLNEMQEAVEEGEVELAYLFTSKLDATMHKYGTRGAEVEAKVTEFAERVQSIYDAASKNYEQVNFYVFSDHGMADTKQVSDMMLRWNKLPYIFGKDYVATWDSTMVRFWFRGNEDVRRATTEWLEQQPEGKIVSDEQLKAWRCYWEDGRYGDLFYLLPAGTIFAPSFMNQKWVNGMHGYTPDHEDSAACWLTNDAEAKPEGLADIFAVMKKAAATETR